MEPHTPSLGPDTEGAARHQHSYRTPLPGVKTPDRFPQAMKTLAVLSSAFCLLGAVALAAGDTVDTTISGGLALYLVGMAFFLGPMLWLQAERRDKQ